MNKTKLLLPVALLTLPCLTLYPGGSARAAGADKPPASPADPAPGPSTTDKADTVKVTFLGVAVENVPAAEAARLALEKGVGLRVTHVVEKSPAATAGLQADDVLVKLGEHLLVLPVQLQTVVENKQAGEVIPAKFLRGGQEQTVSVTLGVQDRPLAWSLVRMGPLGGGVPSSGALPGEASTPGTVVENKQAGEVIPAKSLRGGQEHTVSLTLGVQDRPLARSVVRLEPLEGSAPSSGALPGEALIPVTVATLLGPGEFEQISHLIDEQIKSNGTEGANANNSIRDKIRDILAAHPLLPNQTFIAAPSALLLTSKSVNLATADARFADATGVYVVSRVNGRQHLQFIGAKQGTFEGDIETPKERAKVPAEVMAKAKVLLKELARGDRPSDE